MSYRKSWQEKMADKKGLPKILRLEKKFPCFNAVSKMGAMEGDRCVLVNPREVEEIMRTIPKGKLITLREICMKLAKKYEVEACCTLTSGIFIMTAANAAKEMEEKGKKSRNPYWRTLKNDGYLNPKYPEGEKGHRELLEKEGFTVLKKGKKFKVANFEKYLVTDL